MNRRCDDTGVIGEEPVDPFGNARLVQQVHFLADRHAELTDDGDGAVLGQLRDISLHTVRKAIQEIHVTFNDMLNPGPAHLNYHIRPLNRFGMRTKLFVPSASSFGSINKTMYEELFSENARSLIGGAETDLQFTIELNESGFGVRVMGGPINKDEAGKYFQFEADEFKKCGLFLDLDYYTTRDLKPDGIPKLLHKAVDLMWVKAERIARGLEL